jgi:hypothetical protein
MNPRSIENNEGRTEQSPARCRSIARRKSSGVEIAAAQKRAMQPAENAGTESRRPQSAEDYIRRGTRRERTRATILAPDPTQLRESTASKRTAKGKMTGIVTDRTRQQNVGATWGAALAFATLRATGRSDATVAARQRLIEDAKSRLRLAIGSQRAACANRALAAACSAVRAVTAVPRKLSSRSVKKTTAPPGRPMRPQQPGRGAPGRRETEGVPAARDEIRSAVQASALRRWRLCAAQDRHALRAWDPTVARSSRLPASARRCSGTRAAIHPTNQGEGLAGYRSMRPRQLSAERETARNYPQRVCRLRRNTRPQPSSKDWSERRATPAKQRVPDLCGGFATPPAQLRVAPCARRAQCSAPSPPAVRAKCAQRAQLFREEMRWPAARNERACPRNGTEDPGRHRAHDAIRAARGPAARPPRNRSTLPEFREILFANLLRHLAARVRRIPTTSPNNLPGNRAMAGWRSLKFLRCFDVRKQEDCGCARIVAQEAGSAMVSGKEKVQRFAPSRTAGRFGDAALWRLGGKDAPQ